MPRGDGTGPMGMGAMTGRGTGFCAGYNMPGYLNNAGDRNFGMGFGRGVGDRGMRGGGFGFRNRFFATGIPGRAWFGANAAPYQQADPETEKQFLKNQAAAMENELAAIKKRLGDLEADKLKE